MLGQVDTSRQLRGPGILVVTSTAISLPRQESEMQIASPEFEAKHDLLPSISSRPQGGSAFLTFLPVLPHFVKKLCRELPLLEEKLSEERLHMETTIFLAIFGALEVPFILCPSALMHAISRLEECVHRCLLLQLFSLHLKSTPTWAFLLPFFKNLFGQGT